MVDSVGAKPIGPGSVARIAATQPVTAATTTPSATRPATGADIASLSGVAQAMAASPPVDTDRVARIRKAIEDGKFPLSPSTIADQMIALKLDWIKHDAA